MGAIYLGIEGGGTRTVALWADTSGKVLKRRELGPLNLKLSTDRQVLAILRHSLSSQPAALSLCLAGCRTPADRARLRRLVARVFPRIPCFIGNDLDSGLTAAFGLTAPGILIISGTGSVVVGRGADGHIARAGGWGHLLGDHGSGYWIALTGLRNAIREYDRTGKQRPALHRVLHRLKMKSPERLVSWIHDATKADIAKLAGDVMQGDRALQLQSASFLAMDATAVAEKLGLDQSDVAAVHDRRSPKRNASRVGAHRAPLQIALAGGVLNHNPAFRRWTTHRLRQIFPDAHLFRPRHESAYGAVLLAQQAMS